MLTHSPAQPPGSAHLRVDGSDPGVARRVVAHVDLDAFFASVEQLHNPRLLGQPVVVGGAADQRGVVASASYEARARGIYVPMPLVRAYRLCPDAHFLPGRHEVYRDISRQVFDVVEGFSPCVERASIDEGYLDWTVEQWPMGSSAGRPPRHWPLLLAQRLRDAVLGKTGLSVSIGVGANKLIAKIASKYCKPRGICHVACGAERAFLRPLPLRVVPGIGSRMNEVLIANGFERFADVQDARDTLLEARLGKEWSERLRRIADGVASAELAPRTAPKGISHESTFSHDCRDLDAVRRTLYRLVEKAAWRLRRAGLCARTVIVKLRTSDFDTRTRSRALVCASDCHAELYRAAAELFELLAPRRQAVRLVGVQLTHLEPAAGCQLLLFDQDRRIAARRVNRALDTVRARWGFSKIATAGALGSRHSRPSRPLRSAS